MTTRKARFVGGQKIFKNQPPLKKARSLGGFGKMNGQSGMSYPNNPTNQIGSGIKFPFNINNLKDSFNLFTNSEKQKPRRGSKTETDPVVASQSVIRPWQGVKYEEHLDSGDILFQYDGKFDDDDKIDLVVNFPQFVRILRKQSLEARDVVKVHVTGKLKKRCSVLVEDLEGVKEEDMTIDQRFHKYICDGIEPIINISELERYWIQKDLRTRKAFVDDYKTFRSGMAKLELNHVKKLKLLKATNDFGGDGSSEVFKKFKKSVAKEYANVLDKFSMDRDTGYLKSLNILERSATEILMYLSPSLVRRHWTFAGIAQERENTGAFGQGYIPSGGGGMKNISITRYGKVRALNIIQRNINVNDSIDIILPIVKEPKIGSYIKPMFVVGADRMKALYSAKPYEMTYVDPISRTLVSRTIYPGTKNNYYLGFSQTKLTGSGSRKSMDYYVAKGYDYSNDLSGAYKARENLNTITLQTKQKR